MAIYSNLTVDQGSTFKASIDVSDSDDNAIVLTGYTVAGQLRKSYASLNFTDFTASVTSENLGTITIGLSDTQTNSLRAGRYVYDVEITSPSGEKTRVLEGQLEITPGVTRA